jgi:DNA polymerase III epsilon subunit-like protein
MSLVFVDCEAWGGAPEVGLLTEFGAVDFSSRKTFHGILVKESYPDPENPAKAAKIVGIDEDAYDILAKQVFIEFEAWLKTLKPDRLKFVSDNVAYDWQWINHGFWKYLGRNPFGHSGRRISDFYAGLCKDFYKTQQWKRLRKTPHDHNPMNDAMGNVEAFERMLKGER